MTKSNTTINPYVFYYYALAEDKHYTADEYGNEVCKRTRNKLNDRIISQVEKNMEIIRYVKDDEGNSYYYDNNNNFTLIDFTNTEQLNSIYQHQTYETKQIDYNARQELTKI
jgi:predicted ATP-dependent Lon-type protease